VFPKILQAFPMLQLLSRFFSECFHLYSSLPNFSAGVSNNSANLSNVTVAFLFLAAVSVFVAALLWIDWCDGCSAKRLAPVLTDMFFQ